MAYGDCPECGCPRDWHNSANGHCNGCNKECPTQQRKHELPFEIAQDMEVPHGAREQATQNSGGRST
jgi:hypothetical protein